MAVDFFSEFNFGVVEVKTIEVLHSDGLVEVIQELLHSFFSGEVVAGTVEMRGVQAKADAWAEAFEPFPDLGEFLNGCADFRSLPGGVFQDVFESCFFCFFDDDFGVFDYVLECFLRVSGE